MNNGLPFYECINRLTSELRKVLAEDIEANFESPYHDALEAMLKVHQSNRERGLLYRFLDHPWLVPLSSFLGGIKAFSDTIEERGITVASATLFQKMGVCINVIIPPQVSSILRGNNPVLLLGEHPSELGFDFFAVAASLDVYHFSKTRLRLLALPSTIGICPGLRSIAFPVVQTKQSTIKLITQKGGQPEKLARLWVPEAERRQSMDITTSSLENASNHLLTGGHILIFPDTGIKGSEWFYGIGRIILKVLHRLVSDSELDPYILFFHTTGAKDLLIVNYPFMSRFHPVKFLLLGNHGTISIHYTKLLRVRDHLDIFSTLDKSDLTKYLQREYEQTKSLKQIMRRTSCISLWKTQVERKDI